MKTLKLLLVISLFALFASIFSFQKINLNYSEPFFLIGFRMTISGIILLTYNYFRTKKKKIIITQHLKFFIYLAFYNIYLNSIFEIWGLNSMSSSKVCLIYSLSPFLTSIIAFFLLNEHINIKKIIGIIIGFSGIMPAIYIKNIEDVKNTQLFFISTSELSVILAVIASVLGWIFLKKVIKLGYSFIYANGFSMFIGGILILFHSFIFGEDWNFFPVNNWEKFLIFTFISLIISNIICYNLFGYLLNTFSTTFMTFAGLMTPFFASFFGWLFLHESITWHFFLSISIFSLGLFIFYKEESK